MMANPAISRVHGDDAFTVKCFTEMLLHPEFPLQQFAVTLKPATTTDERTFADSLNYFLLKDRTNGCKVALALIKEFVRLEASQQATAGTLFRDNTFVTHLMAGFGRVVGTIFLKNTIMFTVLEIAADTVNGNNCYEIEEARLEPGQELIMNLEKLARAVKQVLEQIIRSSNIVPPSIQEICATLNEETKVRFPESKHSVIAGFIFLRFICPAIISPDVYNLLNDGTEFTKAGRRALVLVSKVVQVLANQRVFDEKQTDMMAMNPLIDYFAAAVLGWLDVMGEHPEPDALDNSPYAIYPAVTNDAYDGAVQLLYNLTLQNRTPLLQLLAQQRAEGMPVGPFIKALGKLEEIPLHSYSTPRVETPTSQSLTSSTGLSSSNHLHEHEPRTSGLSVSNGSNKDKHKTDEKDKTKKNSFEKLKLKGLKPWKKDKEKDKDKDKEKGPDESPTTKAKSSVSAGSPSSNNSLKVSDNTSPRNRFNSTGGSNSELTPPAARGHSLSVSSNSVLARSAVSQSEPLPQITPVPIPQHASPSSNLVKVSKEDVRKVYASYKKKETAFAWAIFVPYQDSMTMQASTELTETVPELRKALHASSRQTYCLLKSHGHIFFLTYDATTKAISPRNMGRSGATTTGRARFDSLDGSMARAVPQQSRRGQQNVPLPAGPGYMHLMETIDQEKDIQLTISTPDEVTLEMLASNVPFNRGSLPSPRSSADLQANFAAMNY